MGGKFTPNQGSGGSSYTQGSFKKYLDTILYFFNHLPNLDYLVIVNKNWALNELFITVKRAREIRIGKRFTEKGV